MKKLFFSAFWLVACSVMACTNFIVGKNASADGSVIVSYSADSYGMYGNIYRHFGSMHRDGEMRRVCDWDTGKFLGEIPQAKRTYNVVGQMNENQVSITETTFGGREELADSTGMIDYGSLIYIALERSTSAREAIRIMTDLVAAYGYFSEGETFTIADKNEAWIMEMIGKGPGRKGAVWVAVRIPDDCVCAHANQSRITKFNMKDKANVMYSKDVVSFAREKGFFTGKNDADFSFREAYSPNDFSAVRFCEARVWNLFNLSCDGMDKYVDYALGKELKGEMPLWMKPNRKIAVRDVMNFMRNHGEDTPLEIRGELGAGPFNMPYRPTPLTFKVDDKSYFNERPVSTQQTSFCFVGQMRSQLPDEIGGVAWFTNDDPNMAPFTPLYCSIRTVPECFIRKADEQDEITFSWKSAFWLQNTVSNIVYPYYSKMFPDLLERREAVEKNFLENQEGFERMALKLLGLSHEDALGSLTIYSQTCANQMMTEWEQLFRFLVVRHNDMVVKQIDENRKFKRSKYGLCEPTQRVGYPADYQCKAMQEAGEKYLNK